MPLDWAPYDAAAETLDRLGFSCVPGRAGTKGAFPVPYAQYNRTEREHADADVRARWRRAVERQGFEGVSPFWLIASGKQRWNFAVVDVDGPEHEERALEEFGSTQLYTWRGGRLRHLYYRIPSSWTHEERASVHAVGLLGPKSIDIISVTGVYAPGSIHASGEVYEGSIPWDDPRWSWAWLEEYVPMLRASRARELKAAMKPRRLDVERPKVVEGSAQGFVFHDRVRPTKGQYGEAGYVLPGTLVKLENGSEKPVAEVAERERCFATWREDRSPSSGVWKGMFIDRARGVYFRITEGPTEDDDPELARGDLAQALRRRLGLEVLEVDDEGWLSDQLEELPDNSTTFLIAPHGSGKTVFAKQEHARSSSSVSVCNTQALTIANAEVLGIAAVYDAVEAKGSVCIPSLHKYETEPEFFHVDEADAVHGFLHSGIVEKPVDVWRQLVRYMAKSTRALVASADLTFEDIALFSEAIRSAHPERRLRVVLRRPKKERLTVRLCSMSEVQEEIHTHLQSHQGTTFIGTTARERAGAIAQGYVTANSRPAVDLDEVAAISNALDTPRPLPLADVRDAFEDDYQAEVRQPFHVSGANNRHHEAVRWLKDTDRLVEEHDLIVASPAIQSGVSLARPVSRVFVLHDNRGIPAKSIMQLLRRARHPQNRTILIGVPKWSAVPVDLSKEAMMGRLESQDEVRRHLQGEHAEDVEVDPEFEWSWRITERQAARAAADPIGEIVRVAELHGFRVEVDVDVEGSSSAFRGITKAARRIRQRIHAQQVSEAREITDNEAQQLEAAPVLQDGQQAELERHSFERFYERAPTPDLVRIDNRGRFRSRVRAYTHATLVAQGELEVLARHFASLDKMRPRTQLSSVFLRALLFCNMHEHVFGRPFDGTACTLAGVRVDDWYEENTSNFHLAFRGRGPHGDDDFLANMFRAFGATVSRGYATFGVVDDLAVAYGRRLVEAEEKKEIPKWLKDLMLG